MRRPKAKAKNLKSKSDKQLKQQKKLFGKLIKGKFAENSHYQKYYQAIINEEKKRAA